MTSRERFEAWWESGPEKTSDAEWQALLVAGPKALARSVAGAAWQARDDEVRELVEVLTGILNWDDTDELLDDRIRARAILAKHESGGE